MGEKLISVLCIVKNGDTFLEQALGSVRPYVDQVVVVDNNSTDTTASIARKFADVFICKDYTSLFYENKKEKTTEDKVRVNQKNDGLKQAVGKWVLVLDDDEVYSEEDMLRFKYHAKHYDGVQQRISFMHFWKTPYQHITGFVWKNCPERFYHRIDGMFYDKKEDAVQRSCGKFDWEFGIDQFPKVKCLHYSYLKPSEFIFNKIKSYMIKGSPYTTEEQIVRAILRHPYFSNNFNHNMEGKDGVFFAGSKKGYRDKLVNCDLSVHPDFMIKRFKELKLL